MRKKFERLKFLNAGEFQHLNGSLEKHLQGTEAILNAWGADEMLRDAGLFHAAYGTASFNEKMVSLTQREEIASIIGREAEDLVYLYCSCDRDFVFPQFISGEQVRFKNRFNSDTFFLERKLTNQFCELTAANELELVYTSEKFKSKYGGWLKKLFEGMDNYLSHEAKAAYQLALV